MTQSSTRKKDNKRIYLALAILIAIASMAYWLLIITHAYRTFDDGSIDLIAYSYNTYFNLHYPQIASGLQFLVIGNHVSPDYLLLLPIYYFYQSSLTLLYIQIIVICLTSLLIFYVAEKLLKDSFTALILSIIFLVNPGVTGILTYDFHVEFLIVPAYILAFYFYMRSNKKLFVISLLFLLGTVEEAPLLGLTMGLGLLAYELSLSKGHQINKVKKSMLVLTFVLSIITALFYYGSIHYLSNSYKTSYPLLPKPLQVTIGSENGVLSNLHDMLSNPFVFVKNITIYSNPLAFMFLVLSAFIVFFGFGLFTIYRPKITILLLLPWFVAILFWSIHFTYTGYHYFSFTLGASIAAEIIGLMAFIKGLNKKIKIPIPTLVGVTMLVMALILCLVSLIFSATPINYLLNLNNPKPYALYNASQINPLINLIPANASVMTQDFILPHVANRKYVESVWSNETNGAYFVPDYILLSYTNSTQIATNRTFNLFVYSTETYDYELYKQYGNARLYRRIRLL